MTLPSTDCQWNESGVCKWCNRRNPSKNPSARRRCPKAPTLEDLVACVHRGPEVSEKVYKCACPDIPGGRCVLTDGSLRCGPGTELFDIFRTLDVKTPHNCSCIPLARRMNGWGAEGCRQRRAEIVSEIASNASKWGLDELVSNVTTMMVKAVTSGLVLVINPLDPIGSLVDEAIRRAEHSTELPPAVCETCGYRQPPEKPEPLVGTITLDELPPIVLPPICRQRLDTTHLAASDTHIHGSIIEYRSKRYMAYRLHWVNSSIRFCQLGDDWQPVSDAPLNLPQLKQNDLANEDPRLFHFRGELWLQVSAVERVPYRTHLVLYRISERGEVLETVIPQYPLRREWEKNWGPFEHDGQLYAVYSIAPNHIVVKIDLDGTTTKIASTPFELPVPLANARGGAPPVLHNGQFYSWFHSVVSYGGMPTYLMGLYTFEARPPFRTLRYVPGPLLLADDKDTYEERHKSVVFPTGALVSNGRWIVSGGLQDRWTELTEWSVSDVEDVLLDVQTNPMA